MQCQDWAFQMFDLARASRLSRERHDSDDGSQMPAQVGRFDHHCRSHRPPDEEQGPQLLLDQPIDASHHVFSRLLLVIAGWPVCKLHHCESSLWQSRGQLVVQTTWAFHALVAAGTTQHSAATDAMPPRRGTLGFGGRNTATRNFPGGPSHGKSRLCCVTSGAKLTGKNSAHGVFSTSSSCRPPLVPAPGPAAVVVVEASSALVLRRPCLEKGDRGESGEPGELGLAHGGPMLADDEAVATKGKERPAPWVSSGVSKLQRR
eukprot:CAMPEP_0177393028 /NCGR_PEP_ID=MMETSP0368-20130122/54721_1 /TAXON_ID=447022 ORGANISM="Scrippsiella hangoei-like, Strain SHHI-4" /NCGR_SAMPLE_ID=MMETSP0368 /ASSEMBLY_ACC=CAM_ASM_000363 /LENGTH=260 /DNA_ID=CAMNT_0018859161 /DNA_START=292 /DNA_END=1075 /DNA_ORIENTATION=-